MIKTFEEFINENYSENLNIAYSDMYGAPLFNEISESLVSNIYDSIDEGKLVLDTDMLEEGLFDPIAKFFKKKGDQINDKSVKTEIERTSNNRSSAGRILGTGKVQIGDFETIAKGLKQQTEEKIYNKIIGICDSAVEICEKLSEKEEETYNTISDKMTAINEAINDFMDKTIKTINEIVVESKNKIQDVASTVMMFCSKMFEITKEAIKTIGKGVVFAFALPFVFAFAVYKGALKVCETLVEKVKDGAKIVKETFGKIKDAISEWVSNMLKEAKDSLVSACNSIKDDAKSAGKAIGKAYLTIVALLGQLASDAKDMISEYYNNFVESAKEFRDDVKAYISEKWDTVSKWYKKTSTSFAEGVKNVWDAMKNKVTDIIGSAKDAYTTLKNNANTTWGEVEDWSDEKQKEMIKASMKYAADKWGKDIVVSWANEI